MKGIFVTGTDTNVGKTWVGQHLISALCKHGLDVIPRKPIESGWDKNNEENSDAWILANAANKLDSLDEICPNRFSQPISPVRAAMLEERTLSIATIKEQCTPPHFYMIDSSNENNSFLYVEGAGGFYSPLCADGLNADLANALALPIILVAENRLGCINQVLLSVEAIKQRGLNLKAIVLNDVVKQNQENKDMDNQADLRGLLDYPIVSISHKQSNKSVFDDLAFLVINRGVLE